MAAAVLAAAITLGGPCGCATAPVRADLVAVDATPEEVALSYFELAADGDDEAAKALMWRPERFEGATRGDSFRGITNIAVGESWEDTATGRPDEYSELAEIRELTVEFTTHRRSEVGEPPGDMLRFVVIGRDTEDGPWWIVELGTGP